MVLGTAFAVYITRHISEDSRPQLQASILPPPGEGFWANITQPAALSPDGRFLAIIAMRNGHTQLWLRRLDASEAQPIAGTEDAANPFWSPDSNYIGFFVPGKLNKVDISGGRVSDICPAGAFSMGGSWSSQGVIVLDSLGQVLKRVSDRGGAPEPIPGLALSSDALGQQWPSFLPDGKHIFYLEWKFPSKGGRDNGVWIGSLDGEKARQSLMLPAHLLSSSAHEIYNRVFRKVPERLAEKS